ncbi:MAG: hypothetical protein RL217_1532 [Pseudomonadota bacterium]|jgi:cobaltochelatase CobN
MKKLVLAGLALLLSQLSLAAPKVLLVGAAPVQLGKLEMLQPLAKEQGLTLDVKMLDNQASLTPDQLKGYDFLAIDAAYGPAVAMLQTQLLPSLKNTEFPWLWLKRDGNQSHKLPEELVQQLGVYYSNGGKHNYSGYFCTLKAHLTQQKAQCAAPKIYPEAAIYHPSAHSEVFTSLKDFLVFKKTGKIVNTATAAKPDGLTGASKLMAKVGAAMGKSTDKAPSLLPENTPVIGILFHKSYMDSGLTQPLDSLIEKLEKRGALVLPIYASAMKSGEITSLVTYQGKARLDVLINQQIMLNSAGRKEELEALGASVLQTINYHKGDVAAWEKDNIGLTPMDIPFYLSEPEYAGLMDPVVISVSSKNDAQQPIARQMDAVVNKAMNLAQLKLASHKDIKTAILFYNYPPGEKNLGASFLNVPRSLETLLADYQARGYEVKTLKEQELIDELTSLLAPYYRPEKLVELVKQNKAGKLPLKEYLAWFNALPKTVQNRINERWGAPEKASLKVAGENYFAIPALKLGNQYIMPQPPRSEREADKEKQLYHDTKTPPSHSYLATYFWLKNTAKVNAVVHFGTHGSQEWQPGKERGLDMLDDPMLTIGDIPVIYPYIVDNIGEALQTKRRGRAVTISHSTPAFGPAGLHTQLTALHELLHQWLHITDGEVKNQTQKSIKEKAAELKLDKDLNLDLTKNDFKDSVDQLHVHLHDIALANQPLGLARFGVPSDSDLRLFTVQQMLGEKFLEAFYKSRKNWPKNIDEPKELVAMDYEKFKQGELWKWLDAHIRGNQVEKNKSLQPFATQGQEFWKLLTNNQELNGFFTALEGRYVPTSYGGDPIKNPDTLPTGRNLYGFDPSRIPTPEAWEAGKKAAEQLLEQHKAQNGTYPTKLAFTLWSVETMRHLGMLEAQAFALMGYKPVWGQGSRITGIEKIPAKELGRPRVDVVISATGLYRDHFPQVMKWLAQAADEASQLDEPNNPIARNSLEIERSLMATGMSKEDARLAARTRIFSSESGAYSTGLEDATLSSDSFGETKTGEQDRKAGEEKLAKLYLDRMQYAYGPDESRWGEKSKVNVYGEQLKGVQGAVLSRSSNLYGMLTTDDPFQYLGGIGLAVRHLTGQSPSLYISNLRDGNNTRAETAAGFLAKDLRTRYLHPGWIKQMQKEGYSGALEVLGSANNLWGWQVVSPEVVRDDQWQEYKEVYIDDKYKLDINQWFEKNHPQAQAQLIERMLEAARKEYWKTDAKTLQELAERYSELAQKYDVQTDNERFKDYVAQAAAGFGLMSPAEFKAQPQAKPQPAPESAAAPKEVQQVQGQKLEKQPQATEPQPYDWLTLFGIALVLVTVLAGAWRQRIKAQGAGSA